MATTFARGHQLTPKLGCACEYDTCTSPCRFFAKTWRFFFFMADIFSSAGFSCRAESFFTVAEKKVVGSSFTQVFLRLSAQYFVFWPESFCGAFACSICAPVRRGKSRQAPPRARHPHGGGRQPGGGVWRGASLQLCTPWLRTPSVRFAHVGPCGALMRLCAQWRGLALRALLAVAFKVCPLRASAPCTAPHRSSALPGCARRALAVHALARVGL